jgi:hypothetical protein
LLQSINFRLCLVPLAHGKQQHVAASGGSPRLL